ncbi:unnamed protein product [Gongylonema pulchrum]|uniref:I-set domain-containing protein n=1 Tax=Gongylonema pulchrum TaxID=637853 RepID=A0A183D869_9BILA|nr:unnamed protein product [Gongylonema pulchrum]
MNIVKGSIPAGGRFSVVTDQNENAVTLVMQKCKAHDDGLYTLTVENKHGKDSASVKLLVTSEVGLDFRSMLKHRVAVPFDAETKPKPSACEEKWKRLG